MFLLFFRQWLRQYLTYRGELIFRIAVVMIRVVIVISLIRATYVIADKEIIAGVDLLSASWAVVFSQALSAYGSRGMSDTISKSIRSGEISVELISPGQFVNRKMIDSLGNSSASSIFTLPAIVIAAGLFIGQAPYFGINLLTALVLFVCGLIMRLLAHVCLGQIAFMTEETKPFKWIWGKCEMLLGGNILPIPFMPAIMQNIAFWGPFAHFGYTAGLMFA